MATSTISSHNFARFVTSQLGEPASSFSPQNTHELSQDQSRDEETVEAVTMDELMQAAASLDTEMQTIKAQVYKKLLANYSAFSESFEYSLELKDKINGLLRQAEDMTSQTIHPEVEDILSQYEDYMDAGKILQAGHCIQQATKTLAQPPNAGVAASQITKSLTEQCTRMTEATDQMLDELIAGAIRVEHSSDNDAVQKFGLVLSYNVKVPPLSLTRSSSASTPGTIRWHELVRALRLLDVATEKLRPLQKALIRHLIQPLVQHHHQVRLQVNSSGNYASAEGSSISLYYEQGQGGADDLFGQVQRVFRYIHQDIFLGGYSSPEFNAEEFSSDTEILTYFIGRNIAKETCALISKHYLSKIVPTDVEGLNNFGSIASIATQFEDELIAMGFLTEADRELRDFVEHIDIHYTNLKRDTLLKIGRAVIMSDDFKSIPVRDLGREGGPESDGGDWGRIHDPDLDLKESSVSIKSSQLMDMVLNTLHDAHSLSEAAAPHLYQATRSLIDLYRALMPVHHARTLTNVPALAILFYTDCMYIAWELEQVPARLEDGIPGMDEVQYDDVIPALKELAKKWLDIQMQKQREELMQSIDGAGGFQDSSQEGNFAACQRAMKQVVLVFKHLGKAWKSTLSPMTFYRVLGKLLDDAIIRIIKELEALTDISEKESHKLAALCGIVFECEDQFDSAGPLVEQTKGDAFHHEDPIHYFVPSWEKFQLLTDILELSFAEIMTRFRAGQLHMFRERELSNLLCALFADTPLRQHNLEEIEQGHPLLLSRR
ncbi:Centromere/kinetochore protein zw10 [Gamsiella multidivaricata]|nr:Centromere/kinetochore protein zw10 [Gamsiella multidivaricata]